MRSGLRVKSGIAGTKLSSNPPRTMMMGYGVPTLRARIPKATMKKRSRRKTYSTVPISLIQRYSNTHGAASHPKGVGRYFGHRSGRAVRNRWRSGHRECVHPLHEARVQEEL